MLEFMLPHESKLTQGTFIVVKPRFDGSYLQVMTKHFKCDAQMIFPRKKIQHPDNVVLIIRIKSVI